MNRSLIERAMKRMADERAADRPTVPTLKTVAPDSAARPPVPAAPKKATLHRMPARPAPTAPAAASARPITATRTRPSAATAVDGNTVRKTANEPLPTEPVTAAVAETMTRRTRPALDPETRRQPTRTIAAPVPIPVPALIRRGFVDPENKSATVHQEFRLIKRRLLDNAFGKLRPGTENGRRIMVTSALPAEGKTFCAINLAISIAIGGEHPVMLVDADIARPTIARQLDLEEHTGLADLLARPTTDPRSVVLDTDMPGLKLLLAGAHRGQPVDLLASESMTALLDRLSALYPDHVFVIDTPPLLAVTECRTLAANAGQVLLVVAAGETPRAAVQEALVQLEVCDIVGLVLNKTPARPKSPTYYGY